MRLRIILPILPVVLATLLVAPAPAANAATCRQYSDRIGDIVVPVPYLKTGYGLASHGTVRDITNHGLARPGFYNPVTTGFFPTAGFTTIYNETASVTTVKSSNDGIAGLVCGFRALNTPFGPAIYGIQYLNNQGRWGNYNISTGLFYSDGSGWSPIA